MYQGKKIAILGFGIEGQSAYRYFSKNGADITIHDQNSDLQLPGGVKGLLGEDYLKDISGYDLVCRSQSVLPYTFTTEAPITSVMNEFLKHSPGVTIGITGTKGKGTTATLIHHILQTAGKETFLGGNIGTSPLDFLSDMTTGSVAVLEMSNLQLWDIKNSPQIAVLLMIAPEHLDWHRGNLREYIGTKANITKFQTADDLLVFNSHNAYACEIAGKSKAQTLPYLKPEGVWIDGEVIKFKDIAICKTSDVQLLGIHNLENVCAAIAATWEIVKSPPQIRRAIQEFRGLEHRLEFVKEVGGVKYYNDSIGTTPEAGIAAINAFKEPKVLILGGSDKGLQFEDLAREIVAGNVAKVIAIGETASKIVQALKKAGFNKENIVTDLTDMNSIVKAAAEYAPEGGVVLLAPACASFGMFKNYQDRGNQFKEAVQHL